MPIWGMKKGRAAIKDTLSRHKGSDLLKKKLVNSDVNNVSPIIIML